jgi:hypothetical protein
MEELVSFKLPFEAHLQNFFFRGISDIIQKRSVRRNKAVSFLCL